jgi:hypothetical protein
MRLAASTVQSRQFFESTLRGQLFELKNEETIKCTRYGLSINTYALCMARSNLVRQFQKNTIQFINSDYLLVLDLLTSLIFLKVRGAKAKAPVGGAAGGGKGAKAMVKPVLTVETDAKKVNDFLSLL